MKDIVVCDDSEVIANQIAASIQSHYSQGARLMPVDQCRVEIEGIVQRRIDWRHGRVQNRESKFDDAAMVVVDYDLLGDSFTRSFGLTGSEIAYLLRVWSTCGPIVVLNRFREADFDLSFAPRLSSFADLDVNLAFVGEPGLWKDEFSVDRFRPWAWPNLSELIHEWMDLVGYVKAHLDAPLSDIVDLGAIGWQMLSRSDFTVLGVDPGDVERVGLRQLFRRPGLGLNQKDAMAQADGVTDQMIAQVMTARIRHWLARLIVPGQNILVDVPHLAMRLPRSCSMVAGAAMPKIDANLSRYRSRASKLLMRDVYRWPEIQSDESIEDIRDPWSKPHTDLVFFEDVSTFGSREQGAEFVLDTATIYSSRWIRRLDGIRYTPEMLITR